MRTIARTSIVINNYNYGRFLAGAIEGALNQTHPDVEVIVVDDGSTDNSREVIGRYGDVVIPVLKENGGQGSAFNAGFAASRGDLVIFLDADDGLYPDAARRAAEVLAAPGASKAHWPLTVVDERGAGTGTTFPDDEMPEGDFLATALREGPYYDSRFLPPTSGNAWSRRFLERVLPMPAGEFDHGADVYLHALAPAYGRLRRIVEPQGFYRAHGSNHYWRSGLTEKKVREYLGRFESSCAALERHLRDLGHEPEPDEWRRRNFNYLWLDRLRRAREQLQILLPAGTVFVLVNADEWGECEAVPGRTAIPFLERDGHFWGDPADDQQAITELNRMREEGASFLVVWWTCFWWRDHYRRFFDDVDRRFRRVAEDDALIVYSLTDAEG